MNKCTVCGCEKIMAKGLCARHYLQQRKYNKIAERTFKDDNEIVILESYAELTIYDIKGEQKNKAMIDIYEIENILVHRWSSNYTDGNYYVSTKIMREDKSFQMIYLHQFVYGKIKNDNNVLTFKNKNTLDCRKENIIEVDRYILQQNTKLFKNNKSGVKGVSWASREKKWLATIYRKGKLYHLGYFDLITDAAKAREEAEIKYNTKEEPQS